MPRIYDIDHYYREAFSCVINDNIPGLMALIDKIQEFDVSLSTLLNNVRVSPSNDNLFIYAVRNGKLDIVRFLLSRVPNLNIINDYNRIALDIAVKGGYVNIIHAILTMQ